MVLHLLYLQEEPQAIFGLAIMERQQRHAIHALRNLGMRCALIALKSRRDPIRYPGFALRLVSPNGNSKV